MVLIVVTLAFRKSNVTKNIMKFGRIENKIKLAIINDGTASLK